MEPRVFLVRKFGRLCVVRRWRRSDLICSPFKNPVSPFCVCSSVRFSFPSAHATEIGGAVASHFCCIGGGFTECLRKYHQLLVPLRKVCLNALVGCFAVLGIGWRIPSPHSPLLGERKLHEK